MSTSDTVKLWLKRGYYTVIALIALALPILVGIYAGVMVGLSSAALATVSAIMLVRANDLGFRPGVIWHFRRVGFVLGGFTPWAIIWVDIITKGEFLNWFEALFRTGMALVFMTTPYLPPFWKWFFVDAPEDQIKWADDRRGMPRPGRRSTDR